MLDPQQYHLADPTGGLRRVPRPQRPRRPPSRHPVRIVAVVGLISVAQRRSPLGIAIAVWPLASGRVFIGGALGVDVRVHTRVAIGRIASRSGAG